MPEVNHNALQPGHMTWQHTFLIPYMVKPNQPSQSILNTWSALHSAQVKPCFLSLVPNVQEPTCKIHIWEIYLTNIFFSKCLSQVLSVSTEVTVMMRVFTE